MKADKKDLRLPAVAGSFYPAHAGELRELIRSCYEDRKFGPGRPPVVGEGKDRTVVGVVCPHAGYQYSGSAAAWSYDAIFSERAPDSIVVLGTRHTHYFGVAVCTSGSWLTPLGKVPVDQELATALVEGADVLKDDRSAFFGSHGREHNIEVQLPFIQNYDAGVKVVPVKVGVDSWDQVRAVGEGVAKVVRSHAAETGKDVVLVASSDMTHAEIYGEGSRTDMAAKDAAVAKAVEAFDPEATWKAARATTVCGPQTICALMVACKALGATRAEVLKYYTSSDVTGARGGYCVGYMSAAFRK
ncbi:MAG: AmmeMemoRadiSam system protein B [Promethearchaeota archaeon]